MARALVGKASSERRPDVPGTPDELSRATDITEGVPGAFCSRSASLPVGGGEEGPTAGDGVSLGVTGGPESVFFLGIFGLGRFIV